METFITILTKMIDGLHWIRRRCEPRSRQQTRNTPDPCCSYAQLAFGWSPSYDSPPMGNYQRGQTRLSVGALAVDHRCKECKKVIPSCLTSKCSLEVTEISHGETHDRAFYALTESGFQRLPTL